MPPKPKHTKEEIIVAAFEIVKERGADALTARQVAKKLGTTTGPIFTYFESMDELKEEVYLFTKHQCIEDLKGALEYFPAFKEFGLRWIKYVKENPNLYEFLFREKEFQKELAVFINEDFSELFDPLI